jgi:hypothetical protein
VRKLRGSIAANCQKQTIVGDCRAGREKHHHACVWRADDLLFGAEGVKDCA